MSPQLRIAYEIAKNEIGVREIEGRKSNVKINEYHSCTTLQATSDEVAWCSSFMNWCLTVAGLILNPSHMSRKLKNHTRINLVEMDALIVRAVSINEELNLGFESSNIFNLVETGNEIVSPTFSTMARSWLTWGQKTTDPLPGDIVIYQRGNDGVSGHVGFLYEKGIVWNETLGGNQDNQVKIKDYARVKVLGYRTI